MRDFFTKNFQFLVVCGLVLVLFFQRTTEKREITQPVIVVQTDTSWKSLIGQRTQSAPPAVIQTIPYPVTEYPKDYIPSRDYDTLKAQYERLVASHLQTNIQKDSLKIDSIGYVHVTDSVQENLVKARSYSYNLKYPTITNTITIKEPYKPKGQLYVGGGLMAGLDYKLKGADAGVLYKNRKDQMFGAAGGYIKDGAYVKLSSYWKLKIGK